MPSISSEKSVEDLAELDSSIDRSPPKLMKVVELGKDKQDSEEKPVESVDKSDIKEEPNAPVLKVVEIEKSEPILAKMEAQLTAAVSPEKPVPEVKEKEVKETKKKEPEKRGRKPAAKIPKDIPTPEVPKKAEKVEESTESSNEKMEESPYDFKDEPEVEKEIKIRERKKPAPVPANVTVVSPPKEDEKVPEKVPEIVVPVNEEPKPLKGSKDDLGKDLKPKISLFDEKDSAKSDSEVERRGRKKKVTTKNDSVQEVKGLKEIKTNVSVVVNSTDKTSSPERKAFVTLAEKKQGTSPMVPKVIPPSPRKCADNDSAKSEEPVPENTPEKVVVKEEIKKSPDMVVVHKAATIKPDIILGKNIEPVEEEKSSEAKEKQEETVDKEEEEVHSVKRKVRKKTKKRQEMEEQEMLIVGKKTPKRGAGARKAREVSNIKEDSAMSANDSMDIDLHCAEEIRSRSASPENLPGKSYIQESQGFVPRIETIDCRISDSQGSDSYSAQNDISVKSQTVSKMFENTPPTTPEHDSDDTSQQNGQNEQIKIERKPVEESSSKCETSQATGRESPNGNASPSNRSTGSSSGVIAGSEGSVDVPVYVSKRKRETDEPTPTKRRKRSNRGKASNRARQIGK